MKKIICIILFLLSYNLFCETLVFTAQAMRGQAGDSSSETELIGDASIKTETVEINAQSILLSGENYNNISSKGSISGIDKKADLEFSCDNLEYDRKAEVLILYGNVNFTDKKNNVTAKAQIIEYDGKLEVATLQIQINLVKDKNTCTGSYAIYNKNEQLLELSGNATVTQEEDSFRAQYIKMDLNTQSITLDGNVKGSVKDVKSQEIPSDEKDKSDKSDNKGEKMIPPPPENSSENQKETEKDNLNVTEKDNLKGNENER